MRTLHYFTLALLFSLSAYAGLPPTTLSGATATGSKPTTFNFIAPFLQATKVSGINSRIETGYENFLSNPQFEAGTLNWTTSGGGAGALIANTTTDPLWEKQSMLLTDGASGGVVAISPNIDLGTSAINGTNGQYYCRVRTASGSVATNFTMSITDTSGVVIAQSQVFSIQARSGSTAQGFYYGGNFIFPSFSPIQLRITDNVANAVIQVDDCYVGPALNFGITIPSANLFASMEQTSATGCVYSESTSSGSTNFVDLGTGTGCNAWATSGAATAVGTNDHRITVTNMSAADYTVYVGGGFNSSAIGTCIFQLTDGTNVYPSQTFSNGASSSVTPTLTFHISQASNVSSATFKLQAADDFSGNCNWNNAPSVVTKAFWKIYQFPNKAQQTYNMTCPFDGSCVNEFSAQVSAGVITNTNVSNWLASCTNAAPAVCLWQTSLFTQAPNCTVTAVNSGAVAAKLDSAATTTGATVNTFTTNTASTLISAFSIHCSRQGTDVRPVYNAPIFIGAVISSTKQVEDMERVSFGGTTEPSVCNSSPCTMYRNTPGVTSVTRTSPGLYVLHLATGTFSTAPVCVCQDTGFSLSGWCQRATGTVPTATTYTIQTIVNSVVGDSGAVDVICMGPH